MRLYQVIDVKKHGRLTTIDYEAKLKTQDPADRITADGYYETWQGRLFFTQDYIPVKRIKDGVIETTDNRYVKIDISRRKTAEIIELKLGS